MATIAVTPEGVTKRTASFSLWRITETSDCVESRMVRRSLALAGGLANQQSQTSDHRCAFPFAPMTFIGSAFWA